MCLSPSLLASRQVDTLRVSGADRRGLSEVHVVCTQGTGECDSESRGRAAEDADVGGDKRCLIARGISTVRTYPAGL